MSNRSKKVWGKAKKRELKLRKSEFIHYSNELEPSTRLLPVGSAGIDKFASPLAIYLKSQGASVVYVQPPIRSGDELLRYEEIKRTLAREDKLEQREEEDTFRGIRAQTLSRMWSPEIAPLTVEDKYSYQRTSLASIVGEDEIDEGIIRFGLRQADDVCSEDTDVFDPLRYIIDQLEDLIAAATPGAGEALMRPDELSAATGIACFVTGRAKKACLKLAVYESVIPSFSDFLQYKVHNNHLPITVYYEGKRAQELACLTRLKQRMSKEGWKMSDLYSIYLDEKMTPAEMLVVLYNADFNARIKCKKHRGNISYEFPLDGISWLVRKAKRRIAQRLGAQVSFLPWDGKQDRWEDAIDPETGRWRMVPEPLMDTPMKAV